MGLGSVATCVYHELRLSSGLPAAMGLTPGGGMKWVSPPLAENMVTTETMEELQGGLGFEMEWLVMGTSLAVVGEARQLPPWNAQGRRSCYGRGEHRVVSRACSVPRAKGARPRRRRPSSRGGGREERAAGRTPPQEDNGRRTGQRAQQASSSSSRQEGLGLGSEARG